MTDQRQREGERPLVVEPAQRPRRVTPTVERIHKPKRPTWHDTGELRLDELSDEVSGLFELPAPSVAVELSSSARRTRPRSPLERSLRLITAAGLVAVTLVFFAEALAGALQRAFTGDAADRWRSIPLEVRSTPSGAAVFVDDRPLGVTPWNAIVRCRGKQTQVRVQAPGHEIWLWSGLCPYRGRLALHAALQRTP